MPSSTGGTESLPSSRKSSSKSRKLSFDLESDLWDEGQEWILIFDNLLKHPQGKSRGCRCDICLPEPERRPSLWTPPGSHKNSIASDSPGLSYCQTTALRRQTRSVSLTPQSSPDDVTSSGYGSLPYSFDSQLIASYEDSSLSSYHEFSFYGKKW